MKNESLYHKTISILVKAYFNDTLVKAECRKCAVGNIVANAIGIDLTKPLCFTTDDPMSDTGMWFDFLSGGVVFRKPTDDVMIQINLTGYTPIQLAEIERAFMDTGTEYEIYKGLIGVVETLGEIHEVSKETTEETKLMFARS